MDVLLEDEEVPVAVEEDLTEARVVLVPAEAVVDESPLAAVVVAEASVAVLVTADSLLPPEVPVELLLATTEEVVEGEAAEDEDTTTVEEAVVVATLVLTLLLLLLELLSVFGVVEAVMWKGNEYWKVVGSESRLILMP